MGDWSDVAGGLLWLESGSLMVGECKVSGRCCVSCLGRNFLWACYRKDWHSTVLRGSITFSCSLIKILGSCSSSHGVEVCVSRYECLLSIVFQ